MYADANFLLRALEQKQASANTKARARLQALRQADDSLRVAPATIHEVVHVLESHRLGYGWARADVGGVLMSLLQEAALELEELAVLTATAATYVSFGKNGPDFHDCYLASKARALDTKVVSFDRDLDRLGAREAP